MFTLREHQKNKMVLWVAMTLGMNSIHFSWLSLLIQLPCKIVSILMLNDIIYNSWRYKFTKKGKAIGWDSKWDKFKDFYNDVIPFYEEGKKFCRKDFSDTFNPDNFWFLTQSEINNLRPSAIRLGYNGKVQTIKQWCVELDLNTAGVTQRYHKSKKDLSVEEVLFGIKNKRHKSVRCHKDLESQELRNKASKMISSYNNADKKKGFEKSDLNIDWFIDNVFSSKCIYCGDDSRIGLDRIDNTKPHTKSNVTPCCYDCNVARSNNFTHEEMKIIGKSISEVKANRIK